MSVDQRNVSLSILHRVNSNVGKDMGPIIRGSRNSTSSSSSLGNSLNTGKVLSTKIFIPISGPNRQIILPTRSATSESLGPDISNMNYLFQS